MSFSTVPDKATGDVFTEALWDTYVRDNLNKGVIRPLADTSLAAPAATVDLQSIPADFVSLLLVAYLRGDQAVSFTGVFIRFNNDTGANYDYQHVTGNAATAAAAETLAGTSIQVGQAPHANAVGNSYAAIAVEIPNYVQGTNHKAVNSASALKTGTSTGGLVVLHAAGFWRNAAAINRITLLMSSGSFVANSRVSLYGLPN